MREFLIRRLRRAPVIEGLWDQYERMQALLDQALVERHDAMADRTTALAVRDAAIEERDAALAGRYVQADGVGAPNGDAVRSFSLARLGRENPGLARQFFWAENSMPIEEGSLWLHLGCGTRVFDGFVNMDVIPQDLRVVMWNLLDIWPTELDRKVEGVFSECCLEHFFHGEQTYILCNINRALRPGSVARILMPSLAKVIESAPAHRPSPDNYLYGTFGVETGADAVNYAMRFTGHRWFHDQQSLSCMAEACGFEATATDCAVSAIEKFDGLNLRGEANGPSFANDLHKRRHISRMTVFPSAVRGATKIENLAGGAELFVAISEKPVVEYSLPRNTHPNNIACINFRCSNLSTFYWCQKTLTVNEDDDAKQWGFDETLKSQPCMNIMTKAQIKIAFGVDREITKLNFRPAQQPGEYFVLGSVEVFVVD